MRRLRVLQFITPSGFYGAERWVLALANNLDGTRVECDLAVTLEGAGQDLSLADLYPTRMGQVHSIPARGRFDASVISRLRRIIKTRKIDIIHTHGYKSDILGLIAARMSGIKCITTPHGFAGSVDLKLKLFIKAGIYSFRYFDKVVPLSPELLQDVKSFSVKCDRVAYIANGVDLTELDSFRKPADTVGTDAPHIGYVGQLIPRKGVKDLILLFDELWKHYPRARLSLVGDGWQRSQLKEMASQLPSCNAIQFLGFKSERLDYLKQFDLFVMTSSLEGIPRCMMEAMAIGVPVASYDIPGVNEILIHNKTGVSTPLGDWHGLSQQCRRIIEDKSFANRLAHEARELISEAYSAKRMATEYEALFRDVLGLEPLKNSALPGGAG